MGGRVVVLVLLLVLGNGCTRSAPHEDNSPITMSCPEAPAPEPVQCPAQAPIAACPAASELLTYQTKCYEAVSARDQALKVAQLEINDLKEQLKQAQEESEDWRQRFYDAPDCDSY